MKYIDADKLLAVLERQNADKKIIQPLIRIIESLQQEQDIIVINKKDWEAQEQFRKSKDFGKPLQQKQSKVDFEKEMDRFFEKMPIQEHENIFEDTYQMIARHFYELGKKDMKAKMMEEAVEGEVCGRVYDHINVRFADGICKFLEPKNISHIPADVSKHKIGDKVKITVVKEEEL